MNRLKGPLAALVALASMLNRILIPVCTVLLVALLLPSAAPAQPFGMFVQGPPQAPPAYTGPGDVVSGAHAFYGVMAYNATYATGSNPAFSYSCPGGSPSSGTINILTNGIADQATLSTACGANAIVATSIVDQTGNSRPMNAAAAGHQISVALNCSGAGIPCFDNSVLGGCQVTTSSTINDAAGYTFIAAAMVTATSGGNDRVFWSGGSSGGGFNTAASPAAAWVYAGGGGVVSSGSLTLNAFHALAGVIDVGGGSISVDNTTSTGSPGTSAWSGTMSMETDGTTSCASNSIGKVLELGEWPSVFNSTQIGNMSANQHTRYGF